MVLPRYIVLEKAVGETPLSCAEAYRAEHPELSGVPLAYAGRLDPMASGKLLVLVGEECKRQTEYHNLDKEYEFSVLFGISSDTQDVLGRLTPANSYSTVNRTIKHSGAGVGDSNPQLGTVSRPACDSAAPSKTTPGISRHIYDSVAPPETTSDEMPQYSTVNPIILSKIAAELLGVIELPYPHFSAKTVKGKPLHMWTLEGRLAEIEIPTKRSSIYTLELVDIETVSRAQVAALARAKIDTIPPVTDMRKALGNDFRRVAVRQDWATIATGNGGPVPLPDTYTIAHFRCSASSGTYMRSLAALIAQKVGTCGLAWHIHRTKIGRFDTQTHHWTHQY